MNKPIKIGSVTLENKVIVGPMAGVSDISFRSMLVDFKPGLVYSEMISDKAINHRNERTLSMCRVLNEEHPIALQLFGYEVDEMVEAARYLDQETQCDIIDINMGCPVNKVVKGNGGSSLMKEPDRAAAIVYAISQAVTKPVSVKIRSGWDHESINAAPLAIMLEQAGAQMIAIHGRTRTQMYKGAVDHDVIKAVKDALSIPVIGNGDIRSVEDAIAMIDRTDVDGVMVARAVLNDPWLIAKIKARLGGSDAMMDLSVEERLAWLRLRFKTMIDLFGEDIAVKKMRGFAAWFVAGLKNSRELKSLFIKMQTSAEFDKIITDYMNRKE